MLKDNSMLGFFAKLDFLRLQLQYFVHRFRTFLHYCVVVSSIDYQDYFFFKHLSEFSNIQLE